MHVAFILVRQGLEKALSRVGFGFFAMIAVLSGRALIRAAARLLLTAVRVGRWFMPITRLANHHLTVRILTFIMYLLLALHSSGLAELPHGSTSAAELALGLLHLLHH